MLIKSDEISKLRSQNSESGTKNKTKAKNNHKGRKNVCIRYVITQIILMFISFNQKLIRIDDLFFSLTL